jgi:ubiquinone/menaquinone biosynthesis C-methylase UbiE
MDHFQEIYAHQAQDYHTMISTEDCDGALRAALLEGLPVENARILDLGTGTGRLPLIFTGHTPQIVGVDLYHDMLRQNSLERSHAHGVWDLAQADIRALPFPTASADVVTAGWSIGHLRSWYAAEWQNQIGRILYEMFRVARPGGWLVILETLSTGSLTPVAPTPELAEYYAWLESRWGFTRRSIQTDYAFANVDEAVEKTEFFFGPELSASIRKNGWSRLPEWTGMWTVQKDR